MPEHGWGVVGEKLGDASSEVLEHVFPLDEKDKAADIAGTLQASRIHELSWLSTRVSLTEVRPDEDGVEASYVEASNLTHPG